MTYDIKFFRYNEHSILIKWPPLIDVNILNDILEFKNRLQKKFNKQKLEVISSYNSILIVYNYTIDKFNDEISGLKVLYNEESAINFITFSTWEIPVCYNSTYGVDLEDYSKQKKLSPTDVIALHSRPVYTVYFIGFLPGFLYLGGLDKQLYHNRKTTPSRALKKGSVAIGGQQTGIYPQDSPGGWHVIGSTPISMFNSRKSTPCFIKPGDKLKFRSIDNIEYEQLAIESQKANFELKPISEDA
ncbi:5-oxoprolinase subunit PxpB [Winogradskyella aurantia]|uniref:Allophanate hydrolase n=1 Tax=Winogradskyella aurantia TaxID=1915063 RepID=A0A265UXC1_9FLAO|nr:5-oxoprolinase subunit PxpB [Winogradskyella aurantia]OZV69960.1 allophanate hydrolase [Winogradskyella aurantia]